MRKGRVAILVVILLLVCAAGSLAWFADFGWKNLATAPKPENLTARVQQEAKLAEKLLEDITGNAGKKDDPTPGTLREPSFDIIRIAPGGGTSVIAGRAQPGTTVAIVENGTTIGSAKVDDEGYWTFTTEHLFAPGEPRLALQARPPENELTIAQNSVPPPGTATKEAAKPGPQPLSAAAVQTELLKGLEGLVANARKSSQSEAKTPSPPVQEPVAEEKNTAKTAVYASASQLPKPADAPRTASPSDPRVTAPEPQHSIPVPIMFVYREAKFTEEGRKAAALLLEYMRLKKLPSVTLTGHADERGSDELNYNLSRERLDAVAQLLRDGGYQGQLDLKPKGKTEPYSQIDRSKFPLEELYQLDRRVELRLAGQ